MGQRCRNTIIHLFVLAYNNGTLTYSTVANKGTTKWFYRAPAHYWVTSSFMDNYKYLEVEMCK